jgi:hypothetical protein
LRRQCRKYWRKEKRDAMYRIALDYTRRNIDRHADMADGLAVMLLTWNQAAYRYGAPDPAKLERFLRDESAAIDRFRGMDVRRFDEKTDGTAVRRVFRRLLSAMRVKDNRRRSPVGVAKALHLLAPEFFPLWDVKIAQMTGVSWGNDSDKAAGRYVEHMADAKKEILELEQRYRDGARGGLPDRRNLAAALKADSGRDYPKSMLKHLDECYYAMVKLSGGKKIKKKRGGKDVKTRKFR